MEPIIVVGGGLAGLSAAHSVLEHGGKVILLDKKPALGGNSVKASSGINGAGTETQKLLKINDSLEAFYDDTAKSAGPELTRPELITTLTSNSAAAIEWLTQTFNVDLSLVSRLGGSSFPRTHRGTGGAPGWAMTSALMKKLVAEEEQPEKRAQILKNAKVVKLLQTGDRVSGVEYENRQGESVKLEGSVIIATGGFGADFSPSGLISTFRPDLLTLPTVNGDHATGDGHVLATSLASHPGVLVDMDQVQVHPTGFIDPAQPDAKTKFLAAEALRGVGGVLLNKDGERFADEMEKRDVVTARMWEVIKNGQGPVRLVLGVQAATELKTHCDFYLSKGLMQKFINVHEVAENMQVPLTKLQATFDSHRLYASGKDKDPFGKTHFHNSDINTEETFLVAIITLVVHYTMGGVLVDRNAHVLDASGVPVPGLYAAGEVIGGVHGKNRLGGSSLLEAVVFGRISGENAAKGL
ncbi:Flavocytochrome c [Rhodocollybia butyracea]|uniref:Fumarate reductase n=1 Tax=Rhodocollybia butyracea TaxID=206335 RepID=A0A9P5PGX8_9AGAR|nr:Flavocytochrome c [Rhodocollybia butyracea]